MTHPILTQLTELDRLIGDSAEITADRVAYHRKHLRRTREALVADLRCEPIEPNSVHALDSERARQAAAQSDADRGGYLPVRRALAEHV